MISTDKELKFENMRLVDYLHLLFLRRRRLALIPILCGLVSYGSSFLFPKWYASSVSFVSLSKSGLGSGDGLDARQSMLSAALSGSLGSSSNTALYLALLQSNRIRDQVITKFRLNEHYHVGSPISARSLLAKFTILREPRGGLLSILVWDKDPEMAQKVAHAHIEFLNELLTTVGFSQAERQVAFLENRIKVIQSELAMTHYEREQSAKENVYYSLLHEYEIARSNAARDKMDVTIIDDSEVPAGPSFPNPALFALIGLAVGLGISLLSIAIQELWRTLNTDPYNRQIFETIAGQSHLNLFFRTKNGPANER